MHIKSVNFMDNIMKMHRKSGSFRDNIMKMHKSVIRTTS